MRKIGKHTMEKFKKGDLIYNKLSNRICKYLGDIGNFCIAEDLSIRFTVILSYEYFRKMGQKEVAMYIAKRMLK